MLGLDYSQERPSGAQVISAGYGFVARYLDNGLGGRTNLSSAEVVDMQMNAVGVVMVWESTANRAAGGYDAGVADAKAAVNASSNVGLVTLPIYFAIDFDIPDYAPTNPDALSKLGPVGLYFDGVVSVLGVPHTGVYGGYWAVKRVLDAGLATWAWQTQAWSGGNQDPRIHILQKLQTVSVGGVSCDVDEALQSQFGQNAIMATLPKEAYIMRVQNAVNGWQGYFDGNLLRGASPTEAGQDPAKFPIWTLDDATWQAAVARTAAYDAMVGDITSLVTTLNTMVSTDTASQTAVLAAIKGVSTGTVDVNALATALAAALPSHITVTIGSK